MVRAIGAQSDFLRNFACMISGWGERIQNYRADFEYLHKLF